ncbi:hypothetical protein TEA_004980 [Camellia sinensis var. sinensis]|uniref:SHSP domain-containing protein n=1 Tax=Camellia sinensis var. sinensis TaxID=542762 RepID=A0A4S4EF73_CAMSN|nr:hypothetical protein TEA_004980 [Camellia sinensis var. sinensis]
MEMAFPTLARIVMDRGVAVSDYLRIEGSPVLGYYSPKAEIHWTKTIDQQHIPGLKSGDIKVQVEGDNVLVISGERKREEQKDGAKYLRMERRDGKLMRKFLLLENANTDQISTFCQDDTVTSYYRWTFVKPSPETRRNVQHHRKVAGVSPKVHRSIKNINRSRRNIQNVHWTLRTSLEIHRNV